MVQIRPVKMVISEAEWNGLFGESDDEEEFVGFDAEIEEGCKSGICGWCCCRVGLKVKETSVRVM